MQLRNTLLGAAGATALLVGAIAACRSTEDPREGIPGSSTSSGGGVGNGSSSGPGASSSGFDATIAPDATLDCGPAPAATPAFTKQALLGAAAECAAWHTCGFVNAANALRKTMQDGAPAETKNAAWKVAMNEVSTLEGFRFGPWGPKAVDPYQGRSLRSLVHPWPDLSRCEVEKQVVVRDYEKGWDLVLPNGRGLYGLELLFFYGGTDTACFPSSTAGQKWAATPPAELVTAKDAYARALAENIVTIALEARNVYVPAAEGGEGFKDKLVAAQGYGSEQEALNVVGWSLFYPEAEIKDDKLAALSGTQAVAVNRETPFAKVDIENIRTNLRAFRSLFQGCGAAGAGIGFDDWLVSAGHGQLANDILAALGRAEAAADAFPAFDQATQPQFKALYEVVRPLSNLIKGSLFGSGSPLNLKLPASAASDTD